MMISRAVLRNLRLQNLCTCCCRHDGNTNAARNAFRVSQRLLGYHVRSLSSSSVVHAGHSHWKNVAHTKAARDMAISNTITRLSAMLRRAATDAGCADPKKVPEMAKLIEKAKAQNIPNDRINSILTKLNNKKTDVVTFEMKGPMGIMMILETLTDNGNRTESELRSVVKKFPFEIMKGTQAQGIRYNFDEKGVVTVKSPNGKVDMEKAEEVAIEVGAEAVETGATEEEIVFICDPMDIDKVSKSLQSMQYEILDAGKEYFGKNEVKVNEEQRILLEKFVTKLEELSDYSKLHANWV